MNCVEINWWPQWQVTKIIMPNDGHAFFHALCAAFFKPYIDEEYLNQSISKIQIVKKLRKDLAEKLAAKVYSHSIFKYYDLLDCKPTMSLKQMQTHLDSNNSINLNFSYLEFISNQLNKDLFIIFNDTKIWTNIKDRPSIVLYHHQNHYDLIGIKNGQEVITHFQPTHDFILFLKNLL